MDKIFSSRRINWPNAPPNTWQRRIHAHDLFVTAFNNRKQKELPLLLLDSEDALPDGHGVWQHLKTRDGLDKPDQSSEEHAYLMVRVMETWLLADPNALSKYFGSKFKAAKIPAWPDLEAVDKQRIFDTLGQATADCGERKYAKGKISFELLGTIDPQKVKEKCSHAKRFLDFLELQR